MAGLKIKPLGGRVLVKPLEEEEVTGSGLIIPQTADKEKPQQGEIVALGTGKMLEDGTIAKFNVKVGDKVVFKKYSPDEVEVDGVEYLVVDEDDILAVIS
ncbi:MAG: co-chaperone GroES [Candidatus Dojkabacteria bacterium]|nr:co-chaperone GroES [Candidatus Dojkabacteria bacterium]